MLNSFMLEILVIKEIYVNFSLTLDLHTKGNKAKNKKKMNKKIS